jgi:hypothetical protein
LPSGPKIDAMVVCLSVRLTMVGKLAMAEFAKQMLHMP